MLVINLLFEWEQQTHRVLWMSPSSYEMVTIEISSSRSLPTWRDRQELSGFLLQSSGCIIETDPYSGLYHPEQEIPERYRHHRDKAWEIIAPLIATEELIFYADKRGQLIANAVARKVCTEPTIRKYLRQYWQGGQTKNALLPRFDKCGGKGQERLIKSPNTPKRGRPSALSKALGEPLGINVDISTRERILRGAELFYENGQGVPLTEAYKLTLKKLFRRPEKRNGELRLIMPPATQLPSFRQFEFEYHKHCNLVKATLARVGQRRFDKSYRALHGDSTLLAFGPGSLFQVDSTVADIYLISALDRSRIVGRPLLYLIIDVFSRLIVGFCVTLEAPSWLGAKLALQNATENKVKFCRKFDIEITEAEWPSHYLPKAILADRGEFEGYNANHLVNSLNVRVDNTAPYRADLKGIIERSFRRFNDALIHWLPGSVYKKYERGDRDYRLDAVLDIHEFRQLMILFIQEHNLAGRMKGYRMDEFMIQDHIAPYPIDLWNWGIRNRVGSLCEKSSDIIYPNLLPGSTATVTERGIRFERLIYTCKLAETEEWSAHVRISGKTRSIPVSYDPYLVDKIYLRLEDNAQLIACELHAMDRRFQGRDFREVADYFRRQKEDEEAARTYELQSWATLHDRKTEILERAKEKTAEGHTDQSNRSRVRGIQENRKTELLHERATKPLPNGSPEVHETLESTQTEAAFSDEEDYIPRPENLDKFRQLRKQGLSS